MDQNDESKPLPNDADEGASRLLHDATRRDARRLAEFAGASLGAASEADALVVETFASAFRDAQGGDELALETTALFASLRRRCAQALERRRRAPLTPVDERGGPGGRTRALLSAIRPSEREALLLRYVGNLSTAEVARACGVDVEVAEARVSRALTSLCRAARPAVETPPAGDAASERREVEERLAGILAGTAPERVADFVSSDDVSRDFVHDAERLVEVVQGLEAGRDVDPDAIVRAVLAAERENAEPATEPPPAEPIATEVVPEPKASRARSDAPRATEPMTAVARKGVETKAAEPKAARWGAKRRLGVAAMATAVVAVFAWAGGRTNGGRNLDPTAAWSGKIAEVSRAFGDSRGLERCSRSTPATTCPPARSCEPIPRRAR
jgi:RNA polymerase sigma-70 factor (ECF subfamily)